jgi:hypothetical protein
VSIDSIASEITGLAPLQGGNLQFFDQHSWHRHIAWHGHAHGNDLKKVLPGIGHVAFVEHQSSLLYSYGGHCGLAGRLRTGELLKFG